LTAETVLTIAILSALAYSGLFTMPLWIGGLADQFGFSSALLGGLASFQLLCSMLAALWVSSKNSAKSLKPLFLWGTVVVLLANGLSASGGEMKVLLLARGMSGIGEGVLLASLNLWIGRFDNPDRGFALSQTSVGLFGIVLFLTLPSLMAATGIWVLFVSVSCLALSTIPIIAVFINEPLSHQAAVQSKSASWRASTAPLLGLALIFVGCQGAWSYFERMGASQGLALATIGQLLVLGQFLSLAGPLCAEKFGIRFGRLQAIYTGLAVSALAVVCASQSGPVWMFAIGAAIFQFGTLFIVTSFYGYLAAVDESGSAVGAAPAFINAGSAMGPLLMGLSLGATQSMAVTGSVMPYWSLAVLVGMFYLAAVWILRHGTQTNIVSLQREY
jgi:MFS family permease